MPAESDAVTPLGDPGTIVDRRAPRPLWLAAVAVVGGASLTGAMAELGPTLPLQPRMGAVQVHRHAPDRLVVDEAFVFASPWQRWIDDRGVAWGPLRSIAEAFTSRRLPVYVLSERALSEHLDLQGAQYLPNLRIQQLRSELEFFDPLMAFLQDRAGSPADDAS